MKKRLTVLLTAMLILCSCVCPLFVFAVDTDAPEFDIENGVLVRYNGADSDVEIPDGVTAIGEYAFYDKPIQCVSLPDSVIEIGNSAFSRSTLTEINLPEGLRSIGDGWKYCGSEQFQPAEREEYHIISTALRTNLGAVVNIHFQ